MRADGIERIRGWFSEEVLVSPRGGRETIVDLARALLAGAGVTAAAAREAPTRLRESLAEPEHLVFILIDGLGVELLQRCAPGSFLARHRVGELVSVFPSTTAAALTSMATGLYPAQHGVPGWWTYLEEHDLTATVLPYQERFSDLDLRELGVAPEEVFQQLALLPGATRSVLTVTPQPFVQDVFLRYSTGGTPAGGYEDPRQAFQRVIEHVLGAGGPTYTSVYLPHVDEASHHKGVDSPEVRQALAALDSLVAWLHDRLGAEARIVVTGDHGQVTLSPDRVFYLDEGDPMMDCLKCPPTGEATVPYFHVKPDRFEEFEEDFRGLYGEAFELLTAAQVERLELLGPAPMSATTRARIGDLIAIAPRPAALHYRRRGEQVRVHLGVHAGLTPGEMLVPLIVV